MVRSIWNILLPLSVITLVFSAIVTKTTKGVSEAYSPEYAEKYLQDCQETSMEEGLGEFEAKRLCDCTLREFQQKYTLAEFQQLNSAAATDETASNQLIEVGQFCFEELLYE
ncbi:MAG: hypothetical protein QNJ70_15960 [Xenococcaceae cyanobacterium MO_207.B15]|nr:hypothetical protein [Xenococcaceae cyanobacterium MO_207.B15]